MIRRLLSLALPMVALGFGLAAALAIGAMLGESPLHIAAVLFQGAFGSTTDFGYSLYYATPLLLTGLSVSWAFRTGLFNIGADGQMVLGGVTMAACGIWVPSLPPILALPFAGICAFVVGGAWGAIAGWMKVKRGCHEVLTTILLNFVAYGIAGFVILSILKNPQSQAPETAMVGASFSVKQLPGWLVGTSPANWSFALAVFLVCVYGFVMRETGFGFRQRLTGGAPETARRSGINIGAQLILSMFLSGGCAGLAAMSPVLGQAMKAREGFTGGAGFIGIAVALLGRNSPVGIILSALLFGALTKGALDLDLDTQYVSRDLAMVIQALIILAVASQAGLAGALSRRWLKRKARS